MSAIPKTDDVQEPVVLHILPGRLRVHLPEWSGRGQRTLESGLRTVEGVRSARANPVTGNVVIEFDPRVGRQDRILEAIDELRVSSATEPPPPPARTSPPPVVKERRGELHRFRIPVRGLDRDPRLVRHVEERLMGQPGVVRVHANPLTGRVLIECSHASLELADLLENVSDVELPPTPEEDLDPTHPLDQGPLTRGWIRTTGAAIALGVTGARRFGGVTGPAGGSERPAQIATIISLMQGFPFIRNGLRRVFGHTATDVILGTTSAAALAMAGSPVGLTLSLLEGLRSVTEAMARRSSWLNYEEMEQSAVSARPGTTIRLEANARPPQAVKVREGTGTAVGRDGLPVPVGPGIVIPAGAPLSGGPFAMEVLEGDSFTPPTRYPEPPATVYSRYLNAAGLASLGFAIATGVATRSWGRAIEGLLLVNPRTATVGTDVAESSAIVRVIRGGVTVVGTRPQRTLRRPDLLLLDGARVLCDGFEVAGVIPLSDSISQEEVIRLASGVAKGAGSPWGRVFPAGAPAGTDGSFDGANARATVDGVAYRLGPPTSDQTVPGVQRFRERGAYVLALTQEGAERPIGLVALQARLAPDVAELVETCRRRNVELRIVQGDIDEHATASVARRSEISVTEGAFVAATQAAQSENAVVAVLSDSPEAGEAFAAGDLAIGLTDGRNRFPARADFLAPDLGAVAAIVEATARRHAAIRDSVALSVISNIAGVYWGTRRVDPGIVRASQIFYGAALAALLDGWARLAGGKRETSALSRVVDPNPERWGRQPVPEVLAVMETSPEGLTTAEAQRRAAPPVQDRKRNALIDPLLDQVRSPLIGVLAAGAGFSLLLGSLVDVALIGAVIVANVGIGAWQERQASRAAEALEEMSTPTARVLRDTEPTTIPSSQLVPGDIMLLAAGDRVAADARVLDSQGLEVDEAALTGESLPVSKLTDGGDETSRIVLEGSDVVAGSGRAAVVAVGPGTRMGAMAAALALEGEPQSPLGTRLTGMLRLVLPVAVVGGGLVTVAGLLRGQPWLQPLALGTSIAVAAVPEGLPLLARVGEAAVARRLAGEQALVRNLGAVEALGRVDVACADKTGTLTEGRLSLSLIADLERSASPDDELSPDFEQILFVGALASPHPEDEDAEAHPTDVAVVNGAVDYGFGRQLLVERTAVMPFEPSRSFYAVDTEELLCVKGAPEVLAERSTRIRRDGKDVALDDDGRRRLLRRADELAEQGLRVLMVAQGDPTGTPDDPTDLTALGFLGIRDPLRPAVRQAVDQCHKAGIHVIMLTGDHPSTARAIAREAGLIDGGGEVVTATEIAELDPEQLAQRLERATVIARATPLDKLWIVESLKRHDHIVAMTGDGANDGPALRLADVGVAMGRGTEVARHAADVVLVDDDFSTLVETLIEGRVFWRNIRQAMSLLLGGNLGELGLLVPPTLFGLPHPLIPRQVLAVNMITDVLPALTIALQRPEHRRLDKLAREGTAALERPLRLDIIRRGIATAAPSLAAYLLALRSGSVQQAAGVAFASIVGTQLAQTLDLGWSDAGPSAPVLGSVLASCVLLAAAYLTPPVAALLGLTSPSAAGWLLVGAASIGAVLLSRILAVWSTFSGLPKREANQPAALSSLPAPSMA